MANASQLTFLLMCGVLLHFVEEGGCVVGGPTRSNSMPQPKRTGTMSQRTSEDDTGTTKDRTPKYFLFQDSNHPKDENIKVLTGPSTSSTMRSYKQISSPSISMYSDATHFHVMLLAEKPVLLQGAFKQTTEHLANKLDFTKQEIESILGVTYFSRKPIGSLFDKYKVLQNMEKANEDAKTRLDLLVAERQREQEAFNKGIEEMTDREKQLRQQTGELLEQVGKLKIELRGEKDGHLKEIMDHVQTNDGLLNAHRLLEQEHQKTVGEMKSQHEALKADNTQLANEVGKLRNEAATMENAHETAIAGHTATIAKLEREKAVAQETAKELAEMKTHLIELKSILTPFYEERSTLKRDIQELSTKLDEVHESLKGYLEKYKVDVSQFQVVPKDNQEKIIQINKGILKLSAEVRKARGGEQFLKDIMGTNLEQQKIYLDGVRDQEDAKKKLEEEVRQKKINELQAQMVELQGPDSNTKGRFPGFKLSRGKTIMSPQTPQTTVAQGTDLERSNTLAPGALKTSEPQSIHALN